MVTLTKIDDEEMRRTASTLESENPLWIVIFGVYTKQFVGFPRFNVPSGTFAVALYPVALVARMREIELNIWSLQEHCSRTRSSQELCRSLRIPENIYRSRTTC